MKRDSGLPCPPGRWWKQSKWAGVQSRAAGNIVFQPWSAGPVGRSWAENTERSTVHGPQSTDQTSVVSHQWSAGLNSGRFLNGISTYQPINLSTYQLLFCHPSSVIRHLLSGQRPTKHEFFKTAFQTA